MVQHDPPRPEFAPVRPGPLVASGKERAVHAWPGDDTRLLKTVPQRKRAAHGRRNALQRLIKPGPYDVFEREFSVYFRALKRFEAMGRPPPLGDLHGYAMTEDGLAQVVRRIAGADGGIASTLRQIADAGQIDTETLARLTHFAQELFAWHIVAYDVGPQNIVLDHAAPVPRFVLIDGYGDRAWIPLKSWIAALNNRRLNAALGKCANEVGLDWDARNRRFRLPGTS